MLAMALLLQGGLLGGMGGEAGGADGPGDGAATPAEGFLAASGTGELAHLLHLCLFRAFPRSSKTAFKMIHKAIAIRDYPGATQTRCLQGRSMSPGNVQAGRLLMPGIWEQLVCVYAKVLPRGLYIMKISTSAIVTRIVIV